MLKKQKEDLIVLSRGEGGGGNFHLLEGLSGRPCLIFVGQIYSSIRFVFCFMI